MSKSSKFVGFGVYVALFFVAAVNSGVKLSPGHAAVGGECNQALNTDAKCPHDENETNCLAEYTACTGGGSKECNTGAGKGVCNSPCQPTNNDKLMGCS